MDFVLELQAEQIINQAEAFSLDVKINSFTLIEYIVDKI